MGQEERPKHACGAVGPGGTVHTHACGAVHTGGPLHTHACGAVHTGGTVHTHTGGAVHTGGTVHTEACDEHVILEDEHQEGVVHASSQAVTSHGEHDERDHALPKVIDVRR